MMELSGLQLYVMVGLPIVAVLASLTVSLVPVSGIREDMRELRSKEDELLGSYGWVDQRAGIARIPINEALRLTVQRGLPARQEKAK